MYIASLSYMDLWGEAIRVPYGFPSWPAAQRTYCRGIADRDGKRPLPRENHCCCDGKTKSCSHYKSHYSAASAVKTNAAKIIEKYGAPGRIRTGDPLLRRQTLYPTELRARRH
jgi:hypothetical protein